MPKRSAAEAGIPQELPFDVTANLPNGEDNGSTAAAQAPPADLDQKWDFDRVSYGQLGDEQVATHIRGIQAIRDAVAEGKKKR